MRVKNNRTVHTISFGWTINAKLPWRLVDSPNPSWHPSYHKGILANVLSRCKFRNNFFLILLEYSSKDESSRRLGFASKSQLRELTTVCIYCLCNIMHAYTQPSTKRRGEYWLTSVMQYSNVSVSIEIRMMYSRWSSCAKRNNHHIPLNLGGLADKHLRISSTEQPAAATLAKTQRATFTIEEDCPPIMYINFRGDDEREYRAQELPYSTTRNLSRMSAVVNWQ